MVICYSRLNMRTQSFNVFITCCFFNLLFIHLFRKQTRNMSVQLLSHVQFFVIHGLQQARPPCPLSTPRACTNSCPTSQWCHPTLILCCPLLLLPTIFPSIRVFSNKSALHIRWPKYWSFSISPSNEYLGLISFRIDWFDLLAVQGTLKSLLQHRNLKASVHWQSAFFIVQLSHPTTGNYRFD